MRNPLCSFWLTAVFVFMIGYGNAQEIDFERWEIGIDLLPLINKNTIPPSLFIRKLTLKQKERSFGLIRRGLRARVGFDVNKPELSFPFANESYRVVIRPGYEWDVRLKSVEVHYGIDLVGQYDKYHIENTTSTSPVFINQSSTILGVAPIVGVSYKVVKNIKISIESNVEMAFTRSNYVDSQTGIPELKSGFRLRANPIYVLNASFTF